MTGLESLPTSGVTLDRVSTRMSLDWLHVAPMSKQYFANSTSIKDKRLLVLDSVNEPCLPIFKGSYRNAPHNHCAPSFHSIPQRISQLLLALWSHNTAKMLSGESLNPNIHNSQLSMVNGLRAGGGRGLGRGAVGLGRGAVQCTTTVGNGQQTTACYHAAAGGAGGADCNRAAWDDSSA